MVNVITKGLKSVLSKLRCKVYTLQGIITENILIPLSVYKSNHKFNITAILKLSCVLIR